MDARTMMTGIAVLLALSGAGIGALAQDRDAGGLEPSADEVTAALDDLGSALEKVRAGSEAAPGEADPNLLALLAHRRNLEALRGGPEDGAVAIVVPLGFFALLFGLVFAPLLLRHRRRRIEADLQARAIDAGMQFVPELPARPLPRRNDKRTGAMLAGLGLAFALPTALVGATEVAVFGLAPVILGLAFVLIGFFLPTPAAE